MTRRRKSEEGDTFDRFLHAQEAKLTAFLSPISLLLAFLDWGLHLANAPERQSDLMRSAFERAECVPDAGRCAAPLPGDRRFEDPAWKAPPFNLLAQSFLRTEQWWEEAARAPRGVAKAHEDVVAFALRQLLDMVSPTNFAWTNPQVLKATAEQGGLNFLRGWQNWWEDFLAAMSGKRPAEEDGFVVGKDVAATPGKVVLRNGLMELIQYAPAGKKARPEPILIVPAWIMKFYILDLSPRNSLIRYLVEQGFTVFCISWRNPGASQRDLSFDDYRRDGVMAALDAVSAIAGKAKAHACGYCLGGTLLSVAAAAMARDGDHRLASVTLLAAQTDFTEAGELQLFTDESQLALLDDVMWRQGYLDSHQMAGAFQMLRSNDLIWSRLVRAYLLGERERLNDLTAWNADATRMPYRMHSDYLHSMFVRNDLAEGRFKVEGRAVAIGEIAAPIFALGTESDHVAPWRSVYKIHLINPGDITFVLTSGGHNAGIVSEPGHRGRHFRLLRRNGLGEPYLSPEEWLKNAPLKDGSWWPAWTDWLHAKSGRWVPPPPLGAPEGGYKVITSAPGRYVHAH